VAGAVTVHAEHYYLYNNNNGYSGSSHINSSNQYSHITDATTTVIVRTYDRVCDVSSCSVLSTVWKSRGTNTGPLRVLRRKRELHSEQYALYISTACDTIWASLNTLVSNSGLPAAAISLNYLVSILHNEHYCYYATTTALRYCITMVPTALQWQLHVCLLKIYCGLMWSDVFYLLHSKLFAVLLPLLVLLLITYSWLIFFFKNSTVMQTLTCTAATDTVLQTTAALCYSSELLLLTATCETDQMLYLWSAWLYC
jgi:hypothetical protein